MLFQTTQAHEELRARVRAFAEAEIKPIAFMLDKENKFPREQIEALGKMGLMGIPYGTEYEGAGLDVLSYAIAVEELARVDGGAGVILSAHTSLGTYPIAAFGTEEQKKKYLPDLCSGRKIGAFGLTEPNAGSDAGGTETIAEDKGDYYLLNGTKIFITNGGEADTYVVFAVTTPGIGTRGISALIVEKGWEGFTFEEHYDKLGIRSSATCQLNFNDVHVPKENLLGKEGQGFKIAMSTLDGGRIGIAAQALGIAQGAYEAAVEYSKERVQFGKPICQQQSIAFKIADMATKLRTARLLIYSAAELKQAHAPYGMEAAMAKMYASDIARDVTDEALQIFGGSGYLKGMEVERFYRDAKITMIYEGTNEVQRVVISSYILGKAAKEDKAAAAAPAVKKGGETGPRKKMILKEGSAKERVDKLVSELKAEGIDFTVGIPADTPIIEAERVVSAGKGMAQGRVGAGTGCTVGKLVVGAQPQQSGVGSASITLPEGVTVGAVAAVNAVGDVYHPVTGECIACARMEDGTRVPAEGLLMGQAAAQQMLRIPAPGSNTTIGVVAVDCKLTKEQCARLADVAHDGYARAIRPVHTQMDGDTVFSLATGRVNSDVNFIKLCAAAAEVMARAIANAVLFSLDA